MVKAHWTKVKQALLAGEYIAWAVRKVEIPKPQGGVRTLGIPTVVDRLIQQALHQVLQVISSRPSQKEATAFDRAGMRIKRYVKRASTCRKASAGSWTSIWSRSSTGSTSSC